MSYSPYAFASENPEKATKLANKVKAGVAKLGTGPKAKIDLKLKDGAKLKGYIAEINEENFVVMVSKTGQSISVLYSNVKQIKGNNLSTGTIITIGIIAFFVLLFVILHAQRENT